LLRGGWMLAEVVSCAVRCNMGGYAPAVNPLATPCALDRLIRCCEGSAAAAARRWALVAKVRAPWRNMAAACVLVGTGMGFVWGFPGAWSRPVRCCIHALESSGSTLQQQWPVPSSKGPRKPGTVGHPMFKAIAQSDANPPGRFPAAGVLPRRPTGPGLQSTPARRDHSFHHEFQIQSVFVSLGIHEHEHRMRCNASPSAHPSELMPV
jgi:hypothetical protein